MAQFFECCHGCDEETGRHPGCHATCHEYLTAKSSFEEYKNKQRARHEVDIYTYGIIADAKDMDNKRKKSFKRKNHYD